MDQLTIGSRIAVSTGSVLLAAGSFLIVPDASAAPSSGHTVANPATAVVSGATLRQHGKPYREAKAAWRRSAQVSSAESPRHQRHAVRALAKAKGDRYSTPIHQLRALIRLPSTSLTDAEMKRVRELIRRLNRFFHTPELY